MSTLYLKADKESVSKYVIFSGDPFRVEMLSKNLENPIHVAFSREFNTYTGMYKGVKVTVTSTGIGAPSAAIAMEEMYNCGMKVAVRMGTVMGLKDDMLGKMFIPTASMREEATSRTYAPLSFPAVADFELIDCMKKSANGIGRDVITGINCTMDGFYSQMKESRLSNEMGTDNSETFKMLKKYNIRGVDMESSCMLVLANLMGIKACVVTMTTVLENLKEVLLGEARTKSEEELCIAVLDGIVMYDNLKGNGEIK
ncbi:MAG: nucleoside phosphorylase [Oscillospiraceae bacterium]